jgi:DNA-binding GntR family transcriptional regulator
VSAISAEAIPRRTLHGELVERLRDMISDGALQPGTRIPEKLLCLRFGVSRTPLREALKVMASEGLVDLLPNRGATVAKLTVADIEEVIPVLAHLEALAGELASANVTDDEIAEIRLLHYQMALHYTRAERPAYFKINQEIHERIVSAARNRTLANLHRSVAGRIRHARYLANLSRSRWTQAMEEHEEILKALAARDGARLGAILRRHLVNKLESIRASLISEEAGIVADEP